MSNGPGLLWLRSLLFFAEPAHERAKLGAHLLDLLVLLGLAALE
jgi:hypothetical protein